jgi:radical SAM/Cys-rich protein
MGRTAFWETGVLKKDAIETVQINLGDRCNQACAHCHVGASPSGDRNMDSESARRIIERLVTLDIEQVEFTGGTPEMNPNLPLFIGELSRQGKNIAVRTSLTVLDLPEYARFIELYRRHGVRLIASLPSCFEDQTDAQRGTGVFSTSIGVLKRLNSVGYGAEREGLKLDIVYNAVGDYLPPEQGALEAEYKQVLHDRYGITFNNLLTIVNTPIKRFKQHLIRQRKLDDYMTELFANFNPDTLERVMCRRLISVDYQGSVYDCDFNLALGIPIKGYERTKFWEIDFSDFSPEITCDEHCYACTVNRGSSCQGALFHGREGFDAKQNARHYYGDVVRSASDLKTTACCTPDSMPEHVRNALPDIADEIKERYYGCGSPIPLVLDGLTVLDLGCGTGRDSYIMSKLVGETGFVHGIDMTEAQIRVADKYLALQTKRYGYGQPNCRFLFDEIEHVDRHFAPGSLDLVISNCVINLVEDKAGILAQIHALLKPGGEFYFSDIYADRRVPDELRRDRVLHGECLGGALYEKDFVRIARRAGFGDPRVVSRRPIAISNDGVRARIGNIRFSSITYRLWKIAGLEDACEDFGHIAVYRGGVPEAPFFFALDQDHVFEKDRPEKVCGNTALMLSQTRLRDHFDVSGSFATHFGAFRDCRTSASAGQDDQTPAGERSCC